MTATEYERKDKAEKAYVPDVLSKHPAVDAVVTSLISGKGKKVFFPQLILPLSATLLMRKNISIFRFRSEAQPPNLSSLLAVGR